MDPHSATVLDEPSQDDPGTLTQELLQQDDAAVKPSEPPVKKIKVGHHDPKDGIKWLQASTGSMVPFVLRASTGTVHCGNVEMQVVKENGVSVVHCLTGCDPAGSSCFCRLLQAYYDYR